MAGPESSKERGAPRRGPFGVDPRGGGGDGERVAPRAAGEDRGRRRGCGGRRAPLRGSKATVSSLETIPAAAPSLYSLRIDPRSGRPKGEGRMKPAYLFSIIAQTLVLGVGLSSAQAAAPSGSLIVNGSFEDPVIAGSFKLFSSIPGWQPTGSCGPGNVDIEIDRN